MYVSYIQGLSVRSERSQGLEAQDGGVGRVTFPWSLYLIISWRSTWPVWCSCGLLYMHAHPWSWSLWLLFIVHLIEFRITMETCLVLIRAFPGRFTWRGWLTLSLSMRGIVEWRRSRTEQEGERNLSTQPSLSASGWQVPHTPAARMSPQPPMTDWTLKLWGRNILPSVSSFGLVFSLSNESSPCYSLSLGAVFS